MKNTNAVGKKRSGCLWLLLTLLSLLLFIVVKIELQPIVNIHYAESGNETISYVWNVQHQDYHGKVKPGKQTFEHGVIFPGKGFFMEFYWWNSKPGEHCAQINPKWPRTDIYLDAEGNIDTDKTSKRDMARLSACLGKAVIGP